ncbi:MAG TPA: SusC/RagA family TonB-linked outer membrane protein, partial [Saprospiraceae bacterium]|nr:SusC/RagA family TonB-linked outer membrane protein [Saprospiraceae bacterium]
MQTKQFLLLLVAMLAALATTVGQTTISGVVTDAASKEPLIGANIVFTGTSVGTSTEVDGSYSLQVPRGAQAIEISYTGYKTVIVVLDGKSVINVALESGQLLDEVIVIGYGAVAKRDVTGAIASLRPKEGQVLQYDNFQQYLQGRVTGVYIQSNGSELLAPNTVRIRGSNSLRGDNEPLYVVDGIVITSATEDVADPLSSGNSYLAPQSGLTGINPQDIESIEVLKDASATAIYGSRGANGVILITTKKGKEGKAKFSYKATSRMGTPTRLVDVLDTDQYVDYQDEYRKSRGFAPNFYRYADGSIAQFAVDTAFMEAKADSLPKLKPVNWYEDIFQNSFSQNHRLSINGGKANSGYYVALGYSDAKGYVPGVRATQGDFVFNFNQELSPKLTISPRISGAYLNNRASKGTENLGSTNTSLIRQIVLAAPFLGFTENNVDLDASDAIDGPRAWLQDYNDDSEEYRLLASMKADYQISKAFTWRFLAGADYRAKTRQVWFGKSTFRGNQANGEAGISQLDRFRYNVDNTLMYKKKIKRHHTINATAGIVFDATNVKLSSFAASDFANEELRYHGISFGQVFQPLQYDQMQEALMSFLGRFNYTFKDKYLVTASFRSDGASKFAPGNRYSFFPSAALAWKLSEEAFFKKARFSEAKLRIGYGRTGSQAIRPYQTFSRFGATANLLSDGVGGGVSAIVPLNL